MPRQINGRVGFLVLKDKIQAELATGHFLKTVHARYAQELGVGYRQFLRYVEEYGLMAEARPHLAHPNPTASVTIGQDEATPTKRKPIGSEPPRPDRPRKFIFDPANIDKKKLI